MAFQKDEFSVGMIAWYTVKQLKRDRRVRTTNPTNDRKIRPFVCYAEADGHAYWTCLTGTMRPWRKTVDRRLLRNGFGSFGPDDLIISDGRSTFAGPITAFAELSIRFEHHKECLRPFLTGEGVARVKQIVRQRGGLMPVRKRVIPITSTWVAQPLITTGESKASAA